MKFETIAIGDELLDGRVTDGNSGTLARALRLRGLSLTRCTTVPDDETTIVGALNDAAARGATHVVVSGGLGPTEDDRTRQAAAAWAGVELTFDEASMEAIEQKFALVGIRITPNNRRQAWFPATATILPNDMGTAPAFRLTQGGLTAWFLPGVPREYGFFLERDIAPELDASSGSLVVRRMKFYGLSESRVATIVDSASLPASVQIGFRAHFPEIHVSLSAWTDGDDTTALDHAKAAVMAHLGRFLVAEGDDVLEARVGRRLVESDATVTTAESCTGGLVSQRLTSVPGSSAWFERAFITYSNTAKTDLVGVHPDLLQEHGAVSPEVVVAMARGAREAAGADYAVALSGIAGPSGGTVAKPVGTVELAVDTAEGTWYRPLRMRPYWGRDRIRSASATAGLALLLKLLEGRVVDDPKATRVTDNDRAES